jgi:hypothetical protein
MLQNLSEEIRECLRHAEHCKQLSKTALTPPAIKGYLAGWLWPAAMNLQKGCRGSPNRSASASSRRVVGSLMKKNGRGSSKNPAEWPGRGLRPAATPGEETRLRVR